MEERRAERRKLTRGHGPERRIIERLSPISDLRRGEQRRKDRRTDDRRKKRTLPFFSLEPEWVVSDE